MLPALLAAQEVPRKLYSSPIGLSQADVLRILVAPATPRIQGPAFFCDAVVTVEVLDAMNMMVLATIGPESASHKVTGGPPKTETFFSFPCALKPGARRVVES